MITPVQAPADSSPTTLHIQTDAGVPYLTTDDDFQTGEPFSERLEKLKLEFNAQTDRELILVERLAKYDFIHDSIAGYTDMSQVQTSAHPRAATTPEATHEELTRLDQLFTHAQAGERIDPGQVSDIFDWCRRATCDTIIRLFIAHVQKRRHEAQNGLPAPGVAQSIG